MFCVEKSLVFRCFIYKFDLLADWFLYCVHVFGFFMLLFAIDNSLFKVFA